MSVAPSPTLQRLSQPPAHMFELPPLPRAQGAAPGGFSPAGTRLAGVASILNPTQTEESGPGRRKASELESPRASAAALPPLAMNNRLPQAPAAYAGASPANPFSGSVELQPRRILTPRSPALRNAASLSQLAPSSATISAQQMPFPASPSSRAYALPPGMAGAHPLPAPPAATRQSYGFPGPTTNEPPRRASSGATRGAGRASPSPSPSESYSDYSDTDRTSPSGQYPPGSYSSIGEGGQERQRQVGIPISSSGGQNVYQMMTLETTSGTVQLPVDVQAASRVADEKRRRNAGASARFRQRRKEKEKEASTTISKLEQQAKDLNEDMEFYRRERDYMAAVVMQVPGGDRHFPRPPSPRRRRSSSAFAGLSGSHGAGYGSAQETSTRSPNHGRNVRRRTSTLSLPPPPPPQTAMMPHGVPYQTGYGVQTYGTPIAPQPPQPLQPAPGPMQSPLTSGALPAASFLPQAQQLSRPGPPQLMQAPPQTGPWNPYAPDRRPLGPPGPPRDSR